MTTTKNNEHKKLNVPNKQEQNQTCWDSAEREGLRPKGNVPTLRFPEFQEEWDKCELGEFATIIGGYAFKSETLNSIGGKYQVVKMGNLYQNQLDLHRSPSYTDTLTRKAENVILRKDDIAITLTGTNNKRDFGYTYIFNDVKNLLLNQRCGLIRAKGNPYFLSCLLKTHTFLNQFFESATGGTGNQANVSTKAMEMFSVNTPSLKEQEKIGQLMALLDERIATQSKIIEDLKKLKSAIIENHYNQTEKQTASIADLGEPFSVGNLAKDDLTETGMPCVVYGELFTTYGETISQIESHTNKTTGMILSKKGDLLFPSSTTVDAMSLIAPSVINVDGVILGGDMFGIHINHNYNAQYLSYYFNHIAKRQLAKFAKGSTIIHLHYADIEKAKLLLPSLEEQNRMAKCIMSLDAKINIENFFISLLNSQKTHLLRQMFI